MTDVSDTHRLVSISGGVTAAAGFLASGVSAGLKPDGALDVALVVAEGAAVPAAAVFTTNSVAAPPVLVSRRHIASGMARAVVINAGNANACTGARGIVDAEQTARALADALGAESGQMIVSSTGVIGVPLPVDKLVGALPLAAETLSAEGGGDAAHAIMTTDTVAKQHAVSLQLGGRTVCVGGMAKGSGMIKPNMATMLSVITTDAPLTSAACDAALRAAVDTTFNCVTVDSDTSTNDMVVLLASGAAGGASVGPESPEFAAIASAIHVVAEALAVMVARDGEGATKLVTVTVGGAKSDADARLAAFAVADSPLVKTAIFGRDANWGRVAMAIGKCGCAIDPDAFDITFAGVDVCRGGAALGFDEELALAALSADEVAIDIDLHLGDGRARVWTCDLTYDYVRINGEYRS